MPDAELDTNDAERHRGAGKHMAQRRWIRVLLRILRAIIRLLAKLELPTCRYRCMLWDQSKKIEGRGSGTRKSTAGRDVPWRALRSAESFLRRDFSSHVSNSFPLVMLINLPYVRLQS